MIEFLKTWVLNIVTLAILIVILEILIPSGKVKKFINLVSGFILLIAIINPFIGLVSKGADIKDFQIVSSNVINKKEIAQNSKILKDKQMQQITEVYRKKVIGQITSSLNGIEGISEVSADIIINEDYNSNSFGEVKKVYLRLKLNDKGKEVKPVNKINKIEISGNKTSETKDVEAQRMGVNSELKKVISTKLNRLLEIKEENLVISMQKE